MIDLAHLPGLLRRYSFWLVVTPIVFMALALIFLVLKTPEYRASAELLVELSGPQIVTIQATGNGAAQALQPADLDSQVYVLLSAGVLNDVANKLDLDNDPAFNKPGLLTRLLGRSQTPTASQSDQRVTTLKALQDALTVYRLSNSYVFRIQVSHSDPRLAASIANEVAHSYIAQARKARTEALLRTGASLSQQASELRSRVQKAEAEVEAYKVKNGLISTGQGGLVVDQQIQALNSQIAQARVDLEKAKAAYLLAAPLTTADVASGALPDLAQNSVLSTLRLQFATLSQQEAELATTLGTNHPTLRELRSQLASTKQQIEAELQRVKGSLKSTFEQAQKTLTAVEQQSATLQNENSTQGKALIQLRQLQSEADASRAIYEAFLKRSKELEEQPEMDANGSRVLSEAQIPTAPSGPRKIIVLLAAGAFGVAAAAGSAVGITLLRGQITSERELVERTGFPVLSYLSSGQRSSSDRLKRLIPLNHRRSVNDVAAHDLALAQIAYALRQAFAGGPATVLILSASPGEATVSLSREIAAQLHDMGEDVLFAKSSESAVPQMPSPHEDLSEPASKRTAVLANMAAQMANGQSSSGGSNSNSAGGLSRYLTVERIDVQRKYPSQGSLASSAEDFLIVDCGAAQSNPFLPVLLRHCDGILLVSEFGTTNATDLDRVVAYLQPWREQVIGNVVLAAA